METSFHAVIAFRVRVIRREEPFIRICFQLIIEAVDGGAREVDGQHCHRVQQAFRLRGVVGRNEADAIGAVAIVHGIDGDNIRNFRAESHRVHTGNVGEAVKGITVDGRD